MSDLISAWFRASGASVFVIGGLFFVLVGAHLFFNAKKIVPPSRDRHWWITARIAAPFAVATGLLLLWLVFAPQ